MSSPVLEQLIAIEVLAVSVIARIVPRIVASHPTTTQLSTYVV